MKWYYKILLVLIVIALIAQSIMLVYLHRRRVYPDMPTQLTKTYYKPVAIMGINFGEKVADFKPGQHYVLKVFYVKDSEVAFGFSQIEVEGPAK
ncbi:MAG: hypothetical protein GWN77_03265 [Gammaproteobacteria bacterium]|nr:hypothetical protein [Gammaproteobacteria bacterium]NIX01384.1 hypothetical protein [Phycisphaerae bacterium]